MSHCFFFPENKIQWLLKLFGYQHFSKYILCSTESRKSYRFGTSWAWV